MNYLLKFRYSQSSQSLALCSLLSCLVLFSGCASTPAVNALPRDNSAQTTPLAQAAGQQPLYQQVIATLSPEQIELRFKTIDELIQAGKGTLAKQTADQVDKSTLSPEHLNQINLLYTQIMLNFGEAEQAVDNLKRIQPEQLNTDDKIKYYQSLAFANSLTGNLLESAKSRIVLNQLITDRDQYDKNQTAIIETLGLLPDKTLQKVSKNQNDDDLAGWIALTRLLGLKDLPGGNFDDELAKWRESYPGHSGNSAILAMQMPEKYEQKPLELNYAQPSSIALLLPESGPFVQAGKAIRAGFMAAYNSSVNNTKKPSYHFYNSEQPLSALYNQAIAEGAKFVIGPLSKENIQNLADTPALSVPVLALNHVPDLQKNNLYQFGLSPLDDVAEITNKAWMDGHKKALLLVPESEQGERVAKYFSEEWQRLGGTILDSQRFNPKEVDFSATIKKLLNINESEHRYRKIVEAVPSAVFTQRRREDVDVIFLSANSDQARLLNPQLQFHHAATVPVYAMPNVYTGLIAPSLDADLNNITFCDTPWVLNNAYNGELSMSALQKTWETFPSTYMRLIAMGIDAYHLASRINSRDVDHYPGATGKLTLTPDNRIKRSLTCAKFINGQPGVIGQATESPTANQ